MTLNSYYFSFFPQKCSMFFTTEKKTIFDCLSRTFKSNRPVCFFSSSSFVSILFGHYDIFFNEVLFIPVEILKQNMRYSFVACQFINNWLNCSRARIKETREREPERWRERLEWCGGGMWNEKNIRLLARNFFSSAIRLLVLVLQRFSFFVSNSLNKIWIFHIDNSWIVQYFTWTILGFILFNCLFLTFSSFSRTLASSLPLSVCVCECVIWWI